MRIDSIRIQGFRSLRDIEFRPGPLTCLIGANGAGKSNLAAGVSFLQMVYDLSLDDAVEDQGGFDALPWRRGSHVEDEVRFSVEANLPTDALVMEETDQETDSRESGIEALPPHLAGFFCRHHFSLRRRDAGLFSAYTIGEEEILAFAKIEDQRRLVFRGHRDRESPHFRYEIAGGGAGLPLTSLARYAHSLAEASAPVRALTLASDDLAITPVRYFDPLLYQFVDKLAAMRLYQIIPSVGRLPANPNANAELSVEGLGLPTAVASLQGRAPAAWEAVLDAMIEILPTLNEVMVQPDSDGHLRLSFVEGEEGEDDVWQARQVSEGTIRSLALLVAIFDPRHPFVVIEEPENSLHPWAVRVIVDACRVATETLDKQIVLTTHSPVVIDRMRPEEISVAWRAEGATRISPLSERDPDAPRLWAEGATDLSGLLDGGWVRESVPLVNR